MGGGGCSITSPQAWLNIKAGRIWTHVNSTCNQNKSTESIFEEHDKRKNGSNNKESLTKKWDLLPPPPPSPGFLEQIGKECKFLLSNLQDKLSRKNGESYTSSISWLRIHISFVF